MIPSPPTIATYSALTHSDDATSRSSSELDREALISEKDPAWRENKARNRCDRFIRSLRSRSALVVALGLASISAITASALYLTQPIVSVSETHSPETCETQQPVTFSGKPPVKSTYCGQTPSEAMAAGCKYDLLNYGWIPPECDYPELKEWSLTMADPPYRWYLDKDLRYEIPQDPEILGSIVGVWTEERYHNDHCKYMLALVDHVKEKDLPLPLEMTWRNHTEHCYDYLENYKEPVTLHINTFVETTFHPCARLSDEPEWWH